MSDNSEISHLLVQISTGDKRALEQLWVHMKDGLYSFILFYIHDKQLAEDALQETFIAVYKSAGKFRGGTHARAWIFTIAHNSAISLLRKRKEETYELSGTDETSRRIVLLHAVSDLKHHEIAKVLSLPLGTVYRKYSESIRKLKKLYSIPNIREVIP